MTRKSSNAGSDEFDFYLPPARRSKRKIRRPRKNGLGNGLFGYIWGGILGLAIATLILHSCCGIDVWK